MNRIKPEELNKLAAIIAESKNIDISEALRMVESDNFQKALESTKTNNFSMQELIKLKEFESIFLNWK